MQSGHGGGGGESSGGRAKEGEWGGSGGSAENRGKAEEVLRESEEELIIPVFVGPHCSGGNNNRKARGHEIHPGSWHFDPPSLRGAALF